MKKIYMVRRDGDEAEYLDTSKLDCDSWREANDADLTPNAVGEMCDQDAENGNRHDFVGVHRKLFKMLAKQVNGPSLHRIMRKIVDAGGLHGM